EHVGSRGQRRNAGAIVVGQIGVWLAATIGNGHAEACAFFGDPAPDAPHAHDADAARAHAARYGEASQGPGATAGKTISLDDATSAGENQSQGKIGDVLGKLIGRVGKTDAPRRERPLVDPIQTSAE